MSDTTIDVTSDAKSCASCGTAFGTDDDRRYKDCEPCRMGPTVEADVSPPGVSEPQIAEPPESSRIIPDAVTVDVEKHAPPPRPERKLYLCGVTHDAPASYYTMGGINFQKEEGELKELKLGLQELKTGVRDGTVHQLTEEQVALIKQHVADKVIRFEKLDEDDRPLYTGHGTPYSMNGQRNRPYVRTARDVPIGCFLYMVRVNGRKDRPFDTKDIPTMVPRDF